MEQKIIIIHSDDAHVRRLIEHNLAILDALAQEQRGGVLVVGAEDFAELPPVFNISALPRLETADYLMPLGELKKQTAPQWPSRKQLRLPDPHKCSPARASKKGHFRP